MRAHLSVMIPACLLATILAGCASDRSAHVASGAGESVPDSVRQEDVPFTEPETLKESAVTQVEFESIDEEAAASADVAVPAPADFDSTLELLEQTALDQNPRLVRLYQEYQASTSRAQHVDKLPDPKLGANVFGSPIETAAGSQRANLNLSQTIPWLGKLDAEQQRASFEALAIRAEYSAERLRILAGVRTGWYRLYVLDKQIETAEGNQQLLKSLIDVANARIATGNATPGDVLLGTLELSQLEERLLMLHRQRRGVAAEINRLVARPAATSIPTPAKLQIQVPQISASEIHQLALSYQPEIEAAVLRTQATRWGIEVARLSRRPEVSLSASYFVTDNNRPPSPVVDVGADPWAIGVQVSVPLWREKYDAMQNEAGWKHQAAQQSIQELSDRYDALILDLVTEAQRAADTANLYQSTILPQAQQTLSADQEGYSNGAVEFDRVIRDYRSVLTLELGYHEAVGDLAIANTKLQQAAGQDLLFTGQLQAPPAKE